MRAIHDAFPILSGAERVTVLSVNADTKGHIPGADICTHLGHHDVAAEAMHTMAKNTNIR